MPLLNESVLWVKPEGIVVFFLGPKNHSKLGVGEIKGRGESTMVAEHIREKISAPATMLLEFGKALMVTFSPLPRLTVRTSKCLTRVCLMEGLSDMTNKKL